MTRTIRLSLNGFLKRKIVKASSIFFKHRTNASAHSVCTPYPYEHIWKAGSVYIEIGKLITGISLSMGMLPTTERIISRKYEHPC